VSAAKKTTLFLVAAGSLAGILFGVIGLRYLVVPESAARTFGVAGRPAGHELYYIIGLRNLWLAALAIVWQRCASGMAWPCGSPPAPPCASGTR
jgi:hypothetical protein